MQSSTVVIVSAAIVSGGLVAIQGPAFPATASGWASVIAIALISTILAIVTFFAGLERVGPTNASTFSTVEPAVTVVLAAMVLGETISFFRIIGGMMIILAVIILARSEAPVNERTKKDEWIMSMDYRRPALLVTTLGSFLIPFMGSSVNIALPTIGKEFSMNPILLSWLTVSYVLTSAMFLVPFGRIGDIHGRRRVFLYGFVIYTVSSVFSAIAPSPLFLIASRVLNGIGASMTFSTGVAILISVYPPGERGKVLGINVAAIYSGLSCGPFLEDS